MRQKNIAKRNIVAKSDRDFCEQLTACLASFGYGAEMPKAHIESDALK